MNYLVVVDLYSAAPYCVMVASPPSNSPPLEWTKKTDDDHHRLEE